MWKRVYNWIWADLKTDPKEVYCDLTTDYIKTRIKARIVDPGMGF